MARRAALAVVLSVVCLVGSCGESDSDAPAATASAQDREGGVDGPVVYAAQSTDAEDALIEGPIEYEEGCLFVRSTAEPALRYTVLWPFGTTWRSETQSIRLPSGEVAAIGDSVRSGGGYHGSTGLGHFTSAKEALERLASCVDYADSEIAVMQGRDQTVEPNGT